MPVTYSRKCYTDIHMAYTNSSPTASGHCPPVKSWALGCVDKAQFREDSQPFRSSSCGLFRILHLDSLINSCFQAFITVMCLCSSLWRTVHWYLFNLSCMIWCLWLCEIGGCLVTEVSVSFPGKRNLLSKAPICAKWLHFPRCFGW